MTAQTGIKVIETYWKGFRFRSRLEARWAVFFDALGLKWEYETEGFDLDGIYYLPDFWVKDWQIFVEIKREGFGYSSNLGECAKIGALTRALKGRMLVLSGNPYPDEYQAIASLFIHVDGQARRFAEIRPNNPFGPRVIISTRGSILQCIGCEKYICLVLTHNFEFPFTLESGLVSPCKHYEPRFIAGSGELRVNEKHSKSLQNYILSERLRSAFESARSARFEFGESPGQKQEQAAKLLQTIEQQMADVKKLLK